MAFGKKNKNKKGISLIVLVITIIVMIILAAAIIISLTNNGIFGRAKEAVGATNLSEIQHLASVLWGEARLAGAKTKAEFKDAVTEGLKGYDTSDYDIDVTTSGVTVTLKSENVHNGIIPEGGTYTAADGTVYTAGDEFPEIATGDIYTYGDYEYAYKLGYHVSFWDTTKGRDGWGVRCNNNIAEPGPILERINGEPIASMSYTFRDYTQLTVAPAIPDTVTYLDQTFHGCTSLEDVSRLVIPSGVNYIALAFWGCTSLTGNLVIHANITEYSNYRDCFVSTTKPIVLVGNGTNNTTLEAIAAAYDNITVQE